MTNIYENVGKVVADLRNQEEFKALEQAVEAVRADEESKSLFVNFREVQKKLQQKQVAGEEITEEEMVYLQKTAQLAQSNEKILAMLEAEMALSGILEEINRQLFEPIQSMYEDL